MPPELDFKHPHTQSIRRVSRLIAIEYHLEL